MVFLIQIGYRFYLDIVICIIFILRYVCCYILVDKYNECVKEVNKCLYEFCVQLNIICWKLRGFYNSLENIYCDGVYLIVQIFINLCDKLEEFFLFENNIYVLIESWKIGVFSCNFI